MDAGATLKAACDGILADPNLRPVYKNGKLVKTYCNVGARKVAKAVGCGELDDENLMADSMVALMEANASKRWAKVDVATATLKALDGGLVFAAMTGAQLGEAHGHIATVYPVARQRSGTLDLDVPMLANIGPKTWPDGKPNPPIKTSEAFPVGRCGLPSFFAWTDTVST